MMATKPKPEVRRLAFQDQEQQDRAADDAFGRQHRELVGQRLVAHEDVAAQDERGDGTRIVEGARECRPACEQGPGHRQRQAEPQQRRHIERIGEAVGEIDEDGDGGDCAAPGRS